jgi:hypothetical protein
MLVKMDAFIEKGKTEFNTIMSSKKVKMKDRKRYLNGFGDKLVLQLVDMLVGSLNMIVHTTEGGTV